MSLRKVLVLAVGILTVAALVGVASAFGSKPSPTPGIAKTTPGPKASDSDVSEQETEVDSGVHGGPVARFHGDKSTACQLPAGVSLAGNWTHGDYVTAWATTDPTKVTTAAHSGCGKPMHAVSHSPSENAQGRGSGG